MAQQAIQRAVLVSGGGSGIGAAVCRMLAGPGVAILIHARGNQAGCDRVARDVENSGGLAHRVCIDLAEPGAGRRLIEAAIETFGRLDVLIANAGFPHRGSLENIQRTDLDYCFAAMPGAFLEMIQAAMPALRSADQARVVAVSAHAAHMFRSGYPTFPASAAAKRALEVLVQCLAIELAPDGIPVNAVVPGLVSKDADRDPFLSDDERQRLVEHVPMGRFASADEVAAAIVFLASPAASYITNQIIHVNGGMV